MQELEGTAPEMDEDSRGFALRWSKGGFAAEFRCRFGFVLYLPPPAYEIRFKRYRGEKGSATLHDDRAGFAAVVLPEVAGQERNRRQPLVGLLERLLSSPPPLVMLMEVRFGQRLEELPEKLSLVISRE